MNKIKYKYFDDEIKTAIIDFIEFTNDGIYLCRDCAVIKTLKSRNIEYFQILEISQDRERAEEIAQRMRKEACWTVAMCEDLCKEAGLLEKYHHAKVEDIDSVVFEAAELLGVEIM